MIFLDPLRFSECVQVSVGPSSRQDEPRDEQLRTSDGDQPRLQQPKRPRQEESLAKDHPRNPGGKNQGKLKKFKTVSCYLISFIIANQNKLKV